MAREHKTVRLDPVLLEQLERYAEDRGTDLSEALRAAAGATLDAEVGPVDVGRFPWTWCERDFVRFCLGDKRKGVDWPGLTLPDGSRFELEGHLRLIVAEMFASGRVEVLAMLPKGNRKTGLMAAVAVFHVLTVVNANAYIGAADKTQADELYRHAAHFAEQHERLELLLLVRRARREIRSRVDSGFLMVLASDDSRGGGRRQGFNATWACLDELHAHANENLYVDLRSGVFKRDGTLVTISTAGWDRDSVLGKLRQGFLEVDQAGGEVVRGLTVDSKGKPYPDEDGRLTIARSESGRGAMLEWACREDDDLEDMAVVKLANPSKAVTIASLEDAKEAPGISAWAFARYRANVWTLAHSSWIPAGSWEAGDVAGLELDPELPAFAAVDMARFRDCAAVVVVQRTGETPDGPEFVCELTFLRRGTEDDPVEYGPVKAAIRDLHETLNLREVGFDPKYFDAPAEELADEGVPMSLFPQSNERMAPAWADLRSLVISKRLTHAPDPRLRAHVYAGRTKDVGDLGFKVVKQRGRSAPPIDAAVALTMAAALAGTQPAVEPFAWSLA